jgi:hypothetical protein
VQATRKPSELSKPLRALLLASAVAQRRSHRIRLPTYQPKMLAIRKRKAIDGSVAAELS